MTLEWGLSRMHTVTHKQGQNLLNAMGGPAADTVSEHIPYESHSFYGRS